MSTRGGDLSDSTAMTGAEREIAVHRHLMRFGEAESLSTPMWEERGTSVRAIADHLAELWEPTVEPSEPGSHEPQIVEKGQSHARASVLNLIVTVPDASAADRVVDAMLGLGVRHPSRAIVLVADPHGNGRPIDARVSTHCHATPGGGDQICYEEIVLTVRGEAADHLAGVVAPLLIHASRTASSTSWSRWGTGSSSTPPTSPICSSACAASRACGASRESRTCPGSDWAGGRSSWPSSSMRRAFDATFPT
jgi:hypothetical protein